MTDTSSPKRKRRGKAGGQGFYATTFNRREIVDLSETSHTSLADEIAVMRVYIRRLLEYSNTLEPNLDTIITVIRTLGASASHVAKMLQTQSNLKEGEADQIAAEVSRALADVVEEFKL